MRPVSSVLFVLPLLMCGEVLDPAGVGAAGQSPPKSVLMQVRTNFVPSQTACDLYGFVAATPPPQAEAGATLCAMGGPFGEGVIGTVIPIALSFAGTTTHLDRTVVFNETDTLQIRTVFNFAAQVSSGDGGLNYFSGTWEITGGTGAYESLRGQGTAVNAIVSTRNVPPPPEYAVEELVGWATQ